MIFIYKDKLSNNIKLWAADVKTKETNKLHKILKLNNHLKRTIIKQFKNLYVRLLRSIMVKNKGNQLEAKIERYR